MFPKVAQIDAAAVFTLRDPFQNSSKVANVLGYFSKQICSQDVQKFAQFGHTA